MLKSVFINSSLSKTSLFEGCKTLNESKALVADQSCSSRPSSSINHECIDYIRELMFINSHLIIRYIIEENPIASCS